MMSEKFRRQLRQEARQWLEAGDIDLALFDRLAARYQFDALEESAGSNFAAILFGLGGILMGLAVIVFVAANWQELSRAVRVLLLLALLVGTQVGGFFLCQRSRVYRRLGHGLFLLGSLTLGANLALMAQMFHVSGDLYDLLFAWAFGVLAMAWGMRFTYLGLVACALAYVGLANFGLAGSDPVLEVSGFGFWVANYMPAIAIALWLPLAYWCRSRLLFVAALLLLLWGFWRNLLAFSGFALYQTLLLAWLVPLALLWGYDDALRGDRLGTPLQPAAASPWRFQPLARGMAIALLALTTYITSYFAFWQNDLSQLGYVSPEAQLNWHAFVQVMLLAAIAIYSLLRLGVGQLQRFDLTTIVLLAEMLGLGGLLVWHGTLGAAPQIATFWANVLLFLLAIGLVREGLQGGRRASYWFGLVLLSLQVLSRLFEYDTNLLLKAFTLFLCGMATIAAGLWFERYRTRLAERHN